MTSLLLDVLKILLGAAGGALIHKKVEGQPRLIAYWGHVSSFTLKSTNPPLTINTHEVVVRNTGSKAATDVRVTHHHLPEFNVIPSVPYSVDDLPDGRKDIVLPKLVPKQQITIAYLYYAPVTYAQVNAGIRCDQGFSTTVVMELSEKTPRWALVLGWILGLLGLLAIAYLMWMGLRALWV